MQCTQLANRGTDSIGSTSRRHGRVGVRGLQPGTRPENFSDKQPGGQSHAWCRTRLHSPHNTLPILTLRPNTKWKGIDSSETASRQPAPSRLSGASLGEILNNPYSHDFHYFNVFIALIIGFLYVKQFPKAALRYTYSVYFTLLDFGLVWGTKLVTS